jgi:branched-chain amino acid transport system substrate-binding protein
VLKIGSITDMTGARGLQQKRWYDLMAKLYNDAGGWKIGNDTYKVQIVMYDTQGNVQTAKDLLTRAVLQDGCKFIIGWAITGSADVDTTITEPNKVIVFTEDNTGQGTNPKYQYYYGDDTTFATSFSYGIYRDLVKNGAKSYVSVKPDNQIGHFLDPIFNTLWKATNPNINYLGTVWVSPDTVDYGPIGTKIESMHPDVADLTMEGFIPNSIPQTYVALYNNGFKGIILPGIMSQNVLDNLVTSVGKAAVEGGEVMTVDPYTWQQDVRMRSLMDAYVKNYGKWEADAILSMFYWLALESAINHTQSVDTDVIKAYLDNSPAPVQVLDGELNMIARPDVNNYRTTSGLASGRIGVVHDGKLVAGPWATAKDAYLLTIKNNNWIDIYKEYWLKYGYPKFSDYDVANSTLHYSDLGITGQD